MTDNLRTTEALDAISARSGERSARLVDNFACIISSVLLMKQISSKPEVAAGVAGIAIDSVKDLAKLVEVNTNDIDAVCRLMADDIESASPR